MLQHWSDTLIFCYLIQKQAKVTLKREISVEKAGYLAASELMHLNILHAGQNIIHLHIIQIF